MLKFAKPAFAAAVLVLPLAACGGTDDEQTTYEADVEDMGGGEIQVRQPAPDEVPVDLPETPMTSAPQDEATTPAAGETENAAAEQ